MFRFESNGSSGGHQTGTKADIPSAENWQQFAKNRDFRLGADTENNNFIESLNRKLHAFVQKLPNRVSCPSKRK